jgi:hypothetical protein
VSDQQLPLSNKFHTRIIDDLGEHTVRVIDLCERLQVDGLIRLHHRDYDLVEILREKYVHFNLEFTLNERGKPYPGTLRIFVRREVTCDEAGPT